MKRDDDSSARVFEIALALRADEEHHYSIRLFVTGSTPRSLRAIQNIRTICEDKLPGRYSLEVVDIYQHPETAGPEQIIVTPTLIKDTPLPVRRIIGDLSDQARVLIGLDLVSSSSIPTQPEADHGS